MLHYHSVVKVHSVFKALTVYSIFQHMCLYHIAVLLNQCVCVCDVGLRVLEASAGTAAALCRSWNE